MISTAQNFFQKKFEKSVDNRLKVCYTKIVERDKSPKGKEGKTMTQKEIAINIVNEMVENGFHLAGETAEHFAERYGWDIEFLTGILEMVKQW